MRRSATTWGFLSHGSPVNLVEGPSYCDVDQVEGSGASTK
jgi:hypothetical protein